MIITLNLFEADSFTANKRNTVVNAINAAIKQIMRTSNYSMEVSKNKDVKPHPALVSPQLDALMALLQNPDDPTVVIKETDLKIGSWGKGTNLGFIKHPSYGVKVKHKPTGIVVKVAVRKNVWSNKAIACNMIRSALLIEKGYKDA